MYPVENRDPPNTPKTERNSRLAREFTVQLGLLVDGADGVTNTVVVVGILEGENVVGVVVVVVVVDDVVVDDVVVVERRTSTIPFD